MRIALPIGDAPALALNFAGKRRDWNFTMATRQIDHISRLRKARQPATQLIDQRLSVRQRSPPMGGARRKITMMQIVGLHASLNKSTHQISKRVRFVIDTLQQDRLADEINTCLREPFECVTRVGR